MRKCEWNQGKDKQAFETQQITRFYELNFTSMSFIGVYFDLQNHRSTSHQTAVAALATRSNFLLARSRPVSTETENIPLAISQVKVQSCGKIERMNSLQRLATSI